MLLSQKAKNVICIYGPLTEFHWEAMVTNIRIDILYACINNHNAEKNANQYIGMNALKGSWSEHVDIGSNHLFCFLHWQIGTGTGTLLRGKHDSLSLIICKIWQRITFRWPYMQNFFIHNYYMHWCRLKSSIWFICSAKQNTTNMDYTQKNFLKVY